MKRWLYRYEVKGIQDWILNTDKLVEIKGGSALIEGLADLARGLIGALGLGEVGRELQAEDRVVEVMAAAGSATYIFPSREHVATFAAHWPMAVERHAPGIQVVQAWQQGEDKSALDSLFASLGAARNRVPVRLPEAGPLLLRAGRTGSPAVLRSKKHGLLDAATAAKRQQGEPSAGPARRGADPLEKLLGLSDKRHGLTDLDQFGEGYLAVVHADGNGLGQWVQRTGSIQTLADQQRFSRAVGAATLQAAREACAELARRCDQQGSRWGHDLPIRPVLLGGDDFTVILRAADAIAFTDCFLRNFETASRARMAEQGFGQTHFTACAGIAVVKPHWPFSQAHQLSGELCDAAKQRLRREDGTPSGLLFHRVTTALSPEWSAILEYELAADGVPGALAGGPYVTAPDEPGNADEARDKPASLAGLQALAIASQTIGRGARREWATLVTGSRSRADAHFGRLLDVARQRDKAGCKRFEAALRSCGCNADTGWYNRGGGNLATPMYDALVWRAVCPNGVLWRNS